MYKIAVLGDRESVMGFKALGFEVYPASSSEQAREIISHLAGGEYAVIYITEQLASDIEDEISKYKDSVTPAIILIPGKEGTLGSGMRALHSAVERAVGADIL